jgi:hypothetical protein
MTVVGHLLAMEQLVNLGPDDETGHGAELVFVHQARNDTGGSPLCAGD